MSAVRLWPDDVRDPLDDHWTWVTTVADITELMKTGNVIEASLDHDLGEDEEETQLPEGRTLVYWMAENDCCPAEQINLHSARARQPARAAPALR